MKKIVDNPFQKQASYGLGGLAVLFAILIPVAMGSFVIIDAGHVGVIRRWGAVKSVALDEGFHLKVPIADKIEKIDVRLVKAQAASASASKDLQIVQTQVTLQFSIVGDLAPKIFQKIGRRYAVAQTLIEPAIEESVKAVTAKYTAEQLVTQRAEVKLQIQNAIENFIDITLKNKGLDGSVNVANVAITDFAFSEEFNRAIELKVRAEQEALQAKNEKIRRVTQAEAGYAEKKIAADGIAYQIEVQSKARADAIEREAKALKDNPAIIQLRIAEKWSGDLPRITGQGALPLFDVQEMVKDSK